jgi:hypothetical protein
MRNAISAALVLASSSAAFAQQIEAKRPEAPAPAATAAFETREAWCQEYTAWFVGETPAARPAPADVRPNHRLEVEFNSCKLDPQGYERDTLAELPRSAAAG